MIMRILQRDKEEQVAGKTLAQNQKPLQEKGRGNAQRGDGNKGRGGKGGESGKGNGREDGGNKGKGGRKAGGKKEATIANMKHFTVQMLRKFIGLHDALFTQTSYVSFSFASVDAEMIYNMLDF